MKDPTTIRISLIREGPARKEKLEVILKKRGATLGVVVRNLLDAYLELDGDVLFPVELHPKQKKPKAQ